MHDLLNVTKELKTRLFEIEFSASLNVAVIVRNILCNYPFRYDRSNNDYRIWQSKLLMFYLSKKHISKYRTIFYLFYFNLY